MNKLGFQNELVAWHDKKGRKHLPWQVADSYCVWISEIMLQQTQVSSVLGYFKKFISRFPTLNSLAQSEIDDVLSYWSGLGYYNRARNIHKAAKICVGEFDSKLPIELDELMALPGIGRTTAGAILSLSFDLSYPILDGNVKRVLSRIFRISADKPSQLMSKLWTKAEKLVPKENASKYNQGLMDLGSMICKRSKPNCMSCPFLNECKAYKNNEIHLYPQKNKKTKQIAQTLHVLLIKKKDSVFLQKRDNKSIWPGLWFLPIYATNGELENSITHLQGEKTDTFSVVHILTHRKLNIMVTVIQCNSNNLLAGEWQEVESISALPHPTALRKLIKF